MATLSLEDLRLMLAFLKELYTLCNVEMFPNRVLSKLPEVVPSDLTSWSPTNFHQHRIFSSTTSRQFGSLVPQGAEQIANRYFYEHPLVQHYLETNDGRAYKISDFLNEQELHRLESLYQGILRPIDVEDQMIMVLSIRPTVESQSLPYSTDDIVISLHRPQRSFSERDRLVLNLLYPHLIQAYQNAQALTLMQRQIAQLNRNLEQLGAIVLSETGQIQSMTQQAEELLTQYFPIANYQRNYLPELLQRWVNYQISLTASNDDMNFPCLPLRIEQKNRCLIVRLIGDRLQDQYLLLLEEQPPKSFYPETLEATGLTRREAEVLFWAAKDKSTKEIASILSCSDKTVEKHFEHIYQKLGVQSRGAAVFKALDRLGMLN